MGDTVLIVDDSLTVRMDLVEGFQPAGFRTVACATIAEAREFLDRESADVIILDVQLPDGDGVVMLSELRERPDGDNTVILMLSTETEVRDRVRAIKTGADEYIGKPYDIDYVVAKTLELLHMRARPASSESTILIIDDSLTTREELSDACRTAGYAVLTAKSGAEGLRIAGSRRPAAIIVDGSLPDFDGATVIRRIRLDAALRSTPCVLLTGSQDHDAELTALDAGADTFARKEDDVTVVLARLAGLLRNRSFVEVAGDTRSLSTPKRVLAVDHSAAYLNELADRLRGEDYDVVMAHSGEEALELVAVQPVDCILMELVLPGLSGDETCRRIKAVPTLRDLPIIIVTDVEDHQTMIDTLVAGADDYIQKSSAFDVLAARLRAQIRRKQFEDEHRRVRDELLKREIEATEARAEAELSETRARLVGELEQKNRELEAFSYSVSHDLRAPLRGIDGFSQALLEDYHDRLDERGVDYLHRVRAGAQRMGELIDDLLALSRVGRSELRQERVNLSAITADVVAMLVEREPDRLVDVTIQENVEASADGRLMKTALENLLGNAWKFTAHAPDAHIEFGTYEDQAAAVYFVRDNGSGFDMQYVEKLFRPFQRLHSEAEFPGTGIGLATVSRIVERHGGRVWAEGTVGEGATVFFTLSSGFQRW